MKFKNFQLIIGGSEPTKSDIKKIEQTGLSIVKDYGKDWYAITKEFINDRFLWVYCEYDNATIYKDNVLNGDNDKNEVNPRTKSQVELRKQLFFCYDTKIKLLYINNIEKRGFIEHYFSDTLQKNVLIKNIYKSLDDFQNSVKTIKSLRFVQERNFMNLAPGTIFQKQANIYGLNAPQKITMQVDYGNTPIEQAKNALQNFSKWRQSGQFESIILVGSDDSEVEQSFDFSSIIQAIKIDTEKNSNGSYDKDEVKRIFLNEIR